MTPICALFLRVSCRTQTGKVSRSSHLTFGDQGLIIVIIASGEITDDGTHNRLQLSKLRFNLHVADNSREPITKGRQNHQTNEDKTTVINAASTSLTTQSIENNQQIILGLTKFKQTKEEKERRSPHILTSPLNCLLSTPPKMPS